MSGKSIFSASAQVMLALAVAAAGNAAAGHATTIEGCDVAYEGRAVLEVLAELRQRGYEILYSTGVIRPRLHFAVEPAAVAADATCVSAATALPDAPGMRKMRLARLEEALAGVGLGLQRSSGGALFISREDSPAQLPDYGVGRVFDAQTGAPLVGVVVEIGTRRLTTDALGRFRYPMTAEVVDVAHPGYQPRRLAMRVTSSPGVSVPLMPDRGGMEEIVVVSSRYALQDTGAQRHRVDIETLRTMPSLGEDPLRVASLLPGMASIGVSAKPHIRGGSQDELLVLFNNLELLEPFHLTDFQSLFSSFNPSVVESIEVYTGGFPARYGDRMSGVMDVIPATARTGLHGEASLSLLNTSAMLHGTTGEGSGRWVASARRGNLDIVTRQINATVGDPAYSDAFAQFVWATDERAEVDVGAIVYNDDIKLSDFDEDGEIAESRYANVYAWAQLHRQWTPRLFGTTLLYTGRIRHDRDGFLFDSDLDGGEARVRDERAFTLWSLGQLFAYDASDALHAEFGARLTHQRGRYDYRGTIRRGQLAAFLGLEESLDRTARLRPRGLSGGVYGSVRWQAMSNLQLEAGARWDFQDYGQRRERQFSPRISAKLDIGAGSELRLSAGRFYQPEAIHELQVGDGITEYQDVQYADHLIAGWYHEFVGTPWHVRAEIFEKRIRSPKRRYENLFNSLVLLPELASDRVEIRPDRARARGAELTLRYEPHERLLGWFTIAQSSTRDRLPTGWERRTWDQGTTVSAGLSWRPGRWSLGATLAWHEGWRTTALPQFVGEDEMVQVDRNARRLRDYLSVDLHLARTWEWPTQSLTAFATLTNASNRRNVGGVEFDVEALEEPDPAFPGVAPGTFVNTPLDEELLPLVPALGVLWKF